MGNTRTKAVLSGNGKLVSVLFSLALFEQYDIKQLTFASVRHDEQAESLIAKANVAKVRVIQVTTQPEAFGIQCAYDAYQSLGIDRWLAVLGAANQFPNQDVIVVDAGTAITVDFVGADNVHKGGWIAPGLDLRSTAVTEQTDKVFDDSGTNYEYAIGKTTPQALKFGCLAAQLGIVRQAVEYFGRNAQLVIAGGTAQLMMNPLSDLNPYRDDMIVFKGLDLF
jgi:type III pantothenate kinase